VSFPITTDDLEVLIEQHGADLDAYADLSCHGPDVEGLTRFFPDRGPKVFISKTLSTDRRRENRFRTTLAHEFGHVHFHGHLWAEKFATGCLFPEDSDDDKTISKRDDILNAPKSDWMEWQAGYVSGAVLMPLTRVRRLVTDYSEPRGLHGSIHRRSAHASALIERLVEEFAVSEEAAGVRLLKLHLIASSDAPPPLFG